MSSSSENFFVLSTRVLSGEATAAERRAHEQQLRDPETRARFEELRARWAACRDAAAPDFDPHRAYARLAAKLHPPAKQAAPVVALPRVRFGWLAAAAAVAIVAGGVAHRFIREATRMAPAVAAAPRWIERSAAAGELATVVLGDGSRVTLNGRSSLAFPENFGATRRVRLRGEAFFEVAHDSARPFIVEAGDLKTTVRGTTFNVCAPAENAEASVALLAGRVEVEPLRPREGIAAKTLRPGEQLTWDNVAGAVNVSAFDAEAATGWRRGVLAFHDERLATIVGKLERRFGVSFDFAAPRLAGLRISARFERESLPEILDALAFAGGMRWEAVSENAAIARVRLWAAQDQAAAR
jgi:ferric-dicitrate binding protein FerR (iron transport regulator)